MQGILGKSEKWIAINKKKVYPLALPDDWGDAGGYTLLYRLWIGVILVDASRQEITLDAIGIADTNLNMVFLSEPGIRI